MNGGVISIFNQINLTSSDILTKFLNKLSLALNTLDIKEFNDVADGLRKYYNLVFDLTNDTLINQVLAMLAVIYFYNQNINRNTLLLELNNLLIQNSDDEQVNKFVSIIKYFIDNFKDIINTSDKETDIHRKKLILMEKVNKFIDDSEIRDKTVDLMLLMNN